MTTIVLTLQGKMKTCSDQAGIVIMANLLSDYIALLFFMALGVCRISLIEAKIPAF